MTLRALFSILLTSWLLFACNNADSDLQTMSITPALPELNGQYPVASSALHLPDLDSEKLEKIGDYLRGANGAFITDLLADKPGQFMFDLNLPAKPEVYADYAGKTLSVPGLVFYPTIADNSDSDLTLQFSVVDDQAITLPKMQRAAAPQHSDAKKFPLVLFSHGYSANPFYDVTFFEAMASHGFVVVSLFHGDLRFGDLVQSQGIRSLSFHKAVDSLKQSHWSSLIDWQQVGVIGVSFGGSVATILAGGVMNDTLDLPLTQEYVLPKSVIGLVPAIEYRGDAKWDFSNMTTPLFFIMAEDDDAVRLKPSLKILESQPLPLAQVVMLKDEGHFVSPEKWNIVQRLTIQKLKADLHNDQKASDSLSYLREQRDFAEAQLILDK